MSSRQEASTLKHLRSTVEVFGRGISTVESGIALCIAELGAIAGGLTILSGESASRAGHDRMIEAAQYLGGVSLLAAVGMASYESYHMWRSWRYTA